jgi:hypothetical protein
MYTNRGHGAEEGRNSCRPDPLTPESWEYILGWMGWSDPDQGGEALSDNQTNTQINHGSTC